MVQLTKPTNNPMKNDPAISAITVKLSSTITKHRIGICIFSNSPVYFYGFTKNKASYSFSVNLFSVKVNDSLVSILSDLRVNYSPLKSNGF